MPYTIRYNESTKHIDIEVMDVITGSDVRQMIIDAAGMVMDNHCHRILSDYRNSIITATTVEIFEMTNTFMSEMKERGIDFYKVKRAIVVSNNLDDFLFYETAARNKGQQIGIFEDIHEAIHWLDKP